MTQTLSKRLLCGTAFAALLAPSSSLADPTASINLSWVFGEGIAVGVKAFSNDKSGEAAATLGLDYLFSAQQFRPNVGVAYLDDNFFVGLDIGVLNSDWSSVNFGIGVGPLDGDEGNSAGGAGGGGAGGGGAGGGATGGGSGGDAGGSDVDDVSEGDPGEGYYGDGLARLGGSF